ncbi:hypothetical protein TELCIR_07092 [Teladorsagia circumcincta]|uniref:Uncharacterized protein n=1 Tax=Teladorsagia circumcincta TaxID=45464 RepID=A0A2G9UNH4_TELCI|nr:hypothetical protein TELCIR_07092 [Teladorsagia circumcincta]
MAGATYYPRDDLRTIRVNAPSPVHSRNDLFLGQKKLSCPLLRMLLLLLMVPVITMLPVQIPTGQLPTKCEYNGKEYDFNTKFMFVYPDLDFRTRKPGREVDLVGMSTRDVAIILASIFYSVTSQCIDGVHNVITIDSYGSGEVDTPKDFDLFASNLVRATVHLGTTKICHNGESGMIIIPNRICQFDITTVIPPEMCRILQKKGIHTLPEMEKKLNFNSTLELPPSPSFLGITLLDLLKGEYFIKIDVEAGHQKIVEFAMPSGFKALKMGLSEDDD